MKSGWFEVMNGVQTHIIMNQQCDNRQIQKDMPLVSAIVTTYKRRPEVLKRAVLSIVNQSYQELELFVVNDCPSETRLVKEIEETLREIKTDITIHYIVVIKNGGACKARNIGIQLAQGKYIACLDDDDEWKTDKIKKYIEIAEKDENVGIVYGNVITRNNKSGKEYASNRSKPSGDIFTEQLGYNLIGSCSFPLLRKSVVDAVGGFREDMPALQDWELFLRMLKICEAQYIDEPLNIYYIYEGERISGNPKKRVEAYEKLKTIYLHELENNSEAFYSFYMMGCYFYGLNLNVKKGFYHWIQAVSKKPGNMKKNFVELVKLLGRRIVTSKNI